MTFGQLVKGGAPLPSAKMAPTVSAPEQLEARLPGFATSSLSFHGDPLWRATPPHSFYFSPHFLLPDTIGLGIIFLAN